MRFLRIATTSGCHSYGQIVGVLDQSADPSRQAADGLEAVVDRLYAIDHGAATSAPSATPTATVPAPLAMSPAPEQSSPRHCRIVPKPEEMALPAAVNPEKVRMLRLLVSACGLSAATPDASLSDGFVLNVAGLHRGAYTADAGRTRNTANATRASTMQASCTSQSSVRRGSAEGSNMQVRKYPITERINDPHAECGAPYAAEDTRNASEHCSKGASI